MINFEKLYIPLTKLHSYQKFGSVSIANCPDAFDICSIVVNIMQEDTNGGVDRRFVQFMLNKDEVDQMIEALRKIKNDMGI